MHHISRPIILTLLIGVITLALTGCSTHKKSTTTEPSTPAGTVIQTPQVNTVADSYIYGLASTYGTWEYLSLPVDVELAAPQHFKLSGRLHMERGKSIYVSMRFLGMEVATLYITDEMVYATEKLHKYYIAESVPDLLAGINFSVENLQDLLLGRAFVAGQGVLNQSMTPELKITAADNGTDWSLTPAPIRGCTYRFNIQPNPQHVRSIDFMQGDVHRATCYYSEPTRTKGGTMSNVLTVKAQASGKQLQVNLVLNLRDARWGSGNMRQWSMPKGYTQLSRKDLLNMFTSF